MVGGEADRTVAAVALEADEADRGDCVNTLVEEADDGAGADAAAVAAFEADDSGEGV